MGWTARWQEFIRNCPGGVDKLIDWEARNGTVVSVTMQEKPSPSDFGQRPVDLSRYLARFTADYDCYVKIHKGEWTMMVAIASGEYVIDGDIMEMMKKMVSIEAFLDLQRTVPAEY